MRQVIIVILLIFLIFGFSVMLKRNHGMRKEGSCLYVRGQMLKQPIKSQGEYIPQCTLYGHYFQQQCDDSSSTCWCVDKLGAKIDGTDQAIGQQPQACRLSWLSSLYRRMQE